LSAAGIQRWYRVEPHFPDLPAEVAGVRLAEIFGVFGQQADEEVGPADALCSCLSAN
jgi:hypothetical protein